MQRADVYERRYDESTHQTNANTCPECDGRVTMNTAETVCDDCGLVLADQQVDTGPDWRSFEDTDNRARAGAPRTPSRHDRGLTTEIGWSTDGNGNGLSSKKQRKFRRLRRHHSRARYRNKAERNEMYGLIEIRRMTSALGFTNGLRDRACQLFSTAQEAGLLPGRSIETIAAASVYAACRCDGRPQTLGDIAQVAQVPESKVWNGYQVLNRELGLPAAPISPERFLPRFVSTLELSRLVEQTARAVLQNNDNPVKRGSSPAGVASGAVLLAAEQSEEHHRFTQGDLAEVAGVSVVTIRRYRDEFQEAES